MSAGIEVKVEDYDGTYACAFCSESVRGQPALKCSRCSSNPVHRVCAEGTMYERQCATCKGETMEAWRGASAGTAVPSEIIDLRELESEGESAAEVAALTGNGARAEAVPAVGGTEVAAAWSPLALGGDGSGRSTAAALSSKASSAAFKGRPFLSTVAAAAPSSVG